MAEQKCSDCIHKTLGNHGLTMHCTWEKSHLPPPVFRARLWGVDAPKTEDENAMRCAQFQAKE